MSEEMTMDWPVVSLADVCDLVPGFAFKSSDFGNYPDRVIKIKDIQPPFVDSTDLEGVDLSKYKNKNLEKYIVHAGDYVFAMTGATIGKVGIITSGTAYINQRVLVFRPKQDLCDKRFLYYTVLNQDFLPFIMNHIDSQSAQPNISATTVGRYQFTLPPLSVQKRIAKILSSLDDKIEVNSQINRNLEEQAKAIYLQLQEKKKTQKWAIMKAEDLFDISIGKTPPRKESQWFSDSSEDTVWVSIADMGRSGLFIADSSEYLKKEAVSRFNIPIIPKDSVLLSFKLTIGRVSITDCDMTTNEAIAHFVMNDCMYREYLFFYLKLFNYQSMGNTSSIATAVNSKIIKSMLLDIPPVEELRSFHKKVEPLFSKIRINQKENKALSVIRDTLLPKLMSGEMNLS